MTEDRAGYERAEPWRRVAATLVDWAFLLGAASPGLLVYFLAEPLALRAAGLAVAGLVPIAAYFTAHIALENMPGGWLLGVKVMRNSVTSVGAAGHMLRWWVIGWQDAVVSLLSLLVTVPLAYAISGGTGETAIPFSVEWNGITTNLWAMPFMIAFHGYNLWLMGRDRGDTTWDRLMGTFVIRERRRNPSATPGLPVVRPGW